MKKFICGLIITGLSLFAADGRTLSSKCAACHGAVFEKAALGKSAIVYGQSASDIYASLIGYKQGTRNTAGMGALMKGQVAAMSNNDLWAVAEYIASLAEEAAPAAEEADDEWPYACEKPDLQFFALDRYFSGSGNDQFPLILIDNKSISIDKKNKIIKVWTAWLSSDLERKNQIGEYGSKYRNYGYDKKLHVINYNKRSAKLLEYVEYACNGAVINSSALNDGTWRPIVPDSVLETIVLSIMQKYNLK